MWSMLRVQSMETRDAPAIRIRISETLLSIWILMVKDSNNQEGKEAHLMLRLPNKEFKYTRVMKRALNSCLKPQHIKRVRSMVFASVFFIHNVFLYIQH